MMNNRLYRKGSGAVRKIRRIRRTYPAGFSIMTTLLRKKMPHLLALIMIAAISAGCGKIKMPEVNVDKIPWVYKIDVRQGNVVTQEMLDKLKPGMDKRKVRYILGSPLVVSAFNTSRWDYIYSFQPGGEEPEQRRISVFFRNERLHHVEGDVTPHGRTGDGS
uniref:Outer membrane protein assembly factor BamE n=1 Tax=Candidatus Kentrum sp. FM TaxID=2126340 RepID=A0A450S335_9GAMM|nr:MAG: outer membrane protein assembly factor BamE [Candidatus Kentron sp. FM]VFJ58887.1 MAG: outer membrane protein assembly factor BamE [Candidatus Kentron sp. FM]VFK12076.1 MAG: outer membrane protein assembly factor BamE [Candidatus Kentron sp. FM]